MLQSQPLITTIIPTYRRPQLLARAIRSALRQSYPHLQVCVYDNASGDETEQVVAALAREDTRVRYHCHPHNIGMVANFNYGLSQVSTPLFSVLSDDDILLPTFYESALANFQRFPDVLFSACEVIQMTDDGNVIDAPLSFWPREGYFTPPEGTLAMLGGRHPTITGILFRREVVERFGLLSDQMTLADVEFELRITIQAPFVISQKPGAIFTAHPISYSKQADLPLIWREYNYLIQSIRKDTTIPQDTREQAVAIILSYLRPTIWGMGIRSIARQNYTVACEAATILRVRYHLPWQEVILRLSATLCASLPVLSAIFNALYSSGKSVKAGVTTQQLQRQFGSYRRFLEL